MGGTEKKAIFAGDFDPFTIRDAQFIKKSLEYVDELLVYVSNHESIGGMPVVGAKTSRSKVDIGVRKSIIRKWIELSKLGKKVWLYEGDKKSAGLLAGEDKKYPGIEYKVCSSRYLNEFDSNKAHFNTFLAAKHLIVIVQKGHTISSDAEEYFKERGKGLITIAGEDIAEVHAGYVHDCIIRNKNKNQKEVVKELKKFVPEGLEEMVYDAYNPALTSKPA